MYLYQIESSLVDLFDRIDSGEIDVDVAADTIETLGAEYDGAIDDICTKIKQLRADAAAIKSEIECLSARLAEKQKQADRFSELIAISLHRMDSLGYESPRNAVRIRKNPGKVSIADEESFVAWARVNAPFLVNSKVVEKPNKDEIKRRLDGGEEFPGVCIAQGESVVIK